MTVIKVENRPQWAVSSSVVMRLELKNCQQVGWLLLMMTGPLRGAAEIAFPMTMENLLIALFRLVNHR